MSIDTVSRPHPAVRPEEVGMRPDADAGDLATLVRRATRQYPSGVAAISLSVPDAAEPLVIVASSFQVGISFDPPLAMFSAQHTSTSWPKIRAASAAGARIGVSVLADVHGPITRQLSDKRPGRFAGLRTTTLDSGAHLIDGSPLWLECSVHAEHRAGDHDIVLLEVHAARATPAHSPLIWHGADFRTLAPREH